VNITYTPMQERMKKRVYGELTLRLIVGYIGRVPLWQCKCSCGKITTKRQSSIRNGSVKSCGHLRGTQGENRKKHGLRNERLYYTWRYALKKHRKDGVPMYPLWLTDFKHFYDHCMARNYRKGRRMYLVNPDKGYIPDNIYFQLTRTSK
jgi:hypothetical protein